MESNKGFFKMKFIQLIAILLLSNTFNCVYAGSSNERGQSASSMVIKKNKLLKNQINNFLETSHKIKTILSKSDQSLANEIEQLESKINNIIRNSSVERILKIDIPKHTCELNYWGEIMAISSSTSRLESENNLMYYCSLKKNNLLYYCKNRYIKCRQDEESILGKNFSKNELKDLLSTFSSKDLNEILASLVALTSQSSDGTIALEIHSFKIVMSKIIETLISIDRTPTVLCKGSSSILDLDFFGKGVDVTTSMQNMEKSCKAKINLSSNFQELLFSNDQICSKQISKICIPTDNNQIEYF